MKKNTASPSRINQVAKAYMDHHNTMKKAASEGTAAKAPSPDQSDIDSGMGDGPSQDSASDKSQRKLDKIRKPKVPQL